MPSFNKDSNAWGIATLVVYISAVGFMVYLYYRDSRVFRDGIRNVMGRSDVAPTEYSENGKVDEYTAKRTVEDSRNTDSESDIAGL